MYNGGMKTCSFPPCRRKSYAKGLCSTHYYQQRTGNPLRPIRVIKDRAPSGTRPKVCTFEGCTNKHKGRGLCSSHQYQMKVYGELKPLEPRRARLEWGAWYINGYGYVTRNRLMKNGKRTSQLQHRFVMEEHLGRPLRKGENVHHVNGVRHDNRLQNLELWVSSQPSGQRAKDLLTWAEQIIALYGPDRKKL